MNALLVHSAAKTGETLLLDAVNIWITNVIVFALGYWSIDRGGPASGGVEDPGQCDFLFPQMALRSEPKLLNWSPGFVDSILRRFHKCVGIFTNRYDAAERARKPPNDGSVGDITFDVGAGRRSGRQHPNLNT